MLITDKWIGKGDERSSRDLIKSNIPVLAWSNWRKPQKRNWGQNFRVWTQNFLNKSLEGNTLQRSMYGNLLTQRPVSGYLTTLSVLGSWTFQWRDNYWISRCYRRPNKRHYRRISMEEMRKIMETSIMKPSVHAKIRTQELTSSLLYMVVLC
jgi:hypothetical protein